MPFASKAQAKWMHANKPEMAKQWATESPSMDKLPGHVPSKTHDARKRHKKAKSR